MRKLMVFVATVLAAGAGHRYVARQGPEAAYKTFAEEILNRLGR